MNAEMTSGNTKVKTQPIHSSHFPVFELSRDYWVLVFALMITVILYGLAFLMQEKFNLLFGVVYYLTWHSIFEIFMALVCFSVFIISFFTYDQTKDLRSAILGAIFLAVGMLEIFHDLSYIGMPDFFIQNSSSNRATTLWVIARLVASLGFAISAFFPEKMKGRPRKWIFVVPPLAFSILALLLVTYLPDALPAMYLEGKGLTPTKIMLEYLFICILILSAGRYLFLYNKTRDKLKMIFCAALVINISSEIAFSSYYGVYDIYNYMGHVLKIIAYFLIFRVIFIDNVRKPYVELADARDELREYAGNLDILVEQRTKEVRIMNEKLLSDLEYARDIQKAMQPVSFPKTDVLSFSARYFPAERVSGDFYDVFAIDDRYMGLYIGDVSGHGVPAAMLTIFLNQCIHHERESHVTGIGHLTNPSMVLQKVYESFNHTNFSEEVYIILIYGIFDMKTNVLTFASAGLNTFPIILDSGGTLSEIPLKGFPICKFMGYCDVRYENEAIRFKKGDRVLFYTDGLVEVKNEAGERISEKSLKQALSGNQGLAAEGISALIEQELFNGFDMSQLNDDVTFLVMEVN